MWERQRKKKGDGTTSTTPRETPSTPLRCMHPARTHQINQRGLPNAMRALNAAQTPYTKVSKKASPLTHLVQHRTPAKPKAKSTNILSTEVSSSLRSCWYLGALPKLIRGALVRSRRAFAVLHNPGMSFHVLEGNSLLRIQDEKL